MAEVVVSALLPLLVEKLTSAALKSIARYKGLDAEINKLHRSLTLIQDLLADAAQKEITSQSVKRWLNDLQHLAYDIDDVLDDLATDAMEREFTRDSEAITSKVRKLIPTCCTNFSRSTKMLDKLDNINTKLEALFKEKDNLGLKVLVDGETRPRNNNRRFQSSVFDPSRIVGRQAEKEALVQQLLADGPSPQKFDIVLIVGMGGVGKTTLARLLYDDQRVKDHFELKGWVCISDDFDIFGRTKDIFIAVGGELKKELEDFNKLHEALRDHIRGKSFLLVLDDVWCESYADWETLVGPLFTCAPGSKIIVTTRKDQLLKKLSYSPPNKHLESLSYDDAMSLFALHALGVENFDSHLSLKPHGEGIVKKCGRLPLALIALGTSLRRKEDEDSWKRVLESEIWDLPVEGEIIPALKLSYRDLSAPLKQLFAYCSLFPKDFLFDKEELILLWAAEGFLHQSTPSNSTQEWFGHEYFEELLSKSFFLNAPNNESLFVMHDLMSDLATHVAGEFFVRLGNESEKNIRKEMLHHMSFVREKYVPYKNFEAFKSAKSIRTFLSTFVGVVDEWQKFYLSNKIVVDLLCELPYLRVLSLSNFQINEVPESIGTLRHLRYLNLSQTNIKHLPSNVSNLYNLETLILFGCRSLAKLPSNFLRLKNLRHLDVRETPLLDQMPLGIDELKSLQTLSKIIIGGKSKFDIRKLKDFENLCGEVCIVDFDKVQNAIDAREANFQQKRLSKLEVVWSDKWNDSRNAILEKDVFNEPFNDKLVQLKIRSYGGLEFPNWVGDCLLSNLKHVSMRGCKRCTDLPPLAQLPSLKELFIKDLDGVKVVGMELLGTGHAFPSLEILSFKKMHGWEKWSANNSVVFPCLKQLVIKDCPNLVEVTLKVLPSLNVLEINECDNVVLRTLVEVSSVVTKLKIGSISGLNDVVWRGVTENLGAVEDLEIESCSEIRYLWESEAVACNALLNLRNLEVKFCDNLVSLGEKDEEDNCRRNLLTSLRSLDVFICKSMERCICPDSIETLSVFDCSSITTISLPTGGQKLKSLTIGGCNKLLEREWGGQKTTNNKSSMPMLEDVSIANWPNLKSINELNRLVHLTNLSLSNCEGLESLPDNELPNLTSLKHLEIFNCPRMDAGFPRGFWPPNLQNLLIGKLKKPISEWGSQNFPTSLVELTLYGGGGGGSGEDGVSSCSQLTNLLPSSLTSLCVIDFEKLESFAIQLQHLQDLSFSNCPNLNKLSYPQPHHLTSLQHLYFYNCPNMMDLPEELLPSLFSLRMRGNCPKLEERCSKRGGSYWPLISHIPCIEISPDFPRTKLSGCFSSLF